MHYPSIALRRRLVTTDLLSGTETVLSSGELEQALLASAAIPLVFPCVQIDDQFLIDGGVASITPISTAIALGATNVVVIPTGISCGLTQPPRGLVALALHTVNLMSMRQLVSGACLSFKPLHSIICISVIYPAQQKCDYPRFGIMSFLLFEGI